MRKAASIYIYASVVGDNLIENYGSLTSVVTTIAVSLSQHLLLTLTTGNNTVLVSTQNVYVDVVPPTASIIPKYLMFGGDTTGIQMNNGLLSRLSLNGTQTYFLIRMTGAQSETVDLYLY